MLFLRYAYSASVVFKNEQLVYKTYKRLIDQIAEDNDRDFLSALDIINSRESVTIRDKKVKVFGLQYNNHDAFIIVISNLDDKLESFYYCDSYIPTRNLAGSYNYGAVGFAIDQNKVENLADFQRKVLSASTNTKGLADSADNIHEILRRVAITSEDGKLEPSAVAIPTQKQESSRVNCSFKSTNIAMRLLVQMMNPEQKYELSSENLPQGELYDRYKAFRRKATDAAIDILDNFLSEKEKLNPELQSLHELAREDCFIMKYRAMSKKDEPRIKKLCDILTRSEKPKSSVGRPAAVTDSGEVRDGNPLY